ncbi:hypothetical protein ECANGB1_1701 [Enterospora canceri]|uniref:Uncharacterized protein n=1 Tax=Enterospora canceri TaxID=1081671 RepID=A0A1Y1S946_9MICR|nr:hypothetical protein ECANGB1_1701 [Enterospora canceri]
MFPSFFKTKEFLEYVFFKFKLYKSTYNSRSCTKITHNERINTGKTLVILHKLKAQDKTFLPPIYRITNHSIFTKRVVPYSKMVGLTYEYKNYVFHKMKEALEYLNGIHISHTDLSLDSFFIDEAGNPVICDVINLNTVQDEPDDLNDLARLCKTELKTDLDQIGDYEIFVKLETFFSMFVQMKFEEKQAYLEDIKQEKKKMPAVVKLNVFNALVAFLSEDAPKDEKMHVLDFLRCFDSTLFKKNQIQLFRVIDYNVRLYLLQAIESIEKLDECASDIALGIRVKEKPLRFETLNFIFKYDKKFSKKSFAIFIHTITACPLDIDTTQYVCKRLLENDTFHLVTSPIVNKSASYEFLRKNKKENKDYARILYKALFSFLLAKKCKKDVYDCFLKYYKAFDKTKVASELLPILCSRLTDKEYQEDCFNLVEQIVVFLKENRFELEQSDWSINKIKELTKSKSEKREEAIQNKIDEIKAKNKGSEEWEEQEL